MQVTSRQIQAMESGKRYYPEKTGITIYRKAVPRIKITPEILNRNLEALNELKFPLFYEIKENWIWFACKRPVVLKAAIEKLMRADKMDYGAVIQYKNAVKYQPTGVIKFEDISE